jgi:hypothetical protein
VYGDRTDEIDVRERMRFPHGCFLVIDAREPDTLAGAVYIELFWPRLPSPIHPSCACPHICC